jgi:hypothetical protein
VLDDTALEALRLGERTGSLLGGAEFSAHLEAKTPGLSRRTNRTIAIRIARAIADPKKGFPARMNFSPVTHVREVCSNLLRICR